MNAKLFLVYLRIRKLLPAIAILSLAVTIYNQFLNYHHSLADTNPWIVKDVLSGNFLTVVRGDETLNIKLCGISANSGESQEYLRSLLDKGNGSVVVNPVRKEDNVTIAEVFVQILPDYEQEIHVNSEMISKGMAVLQNPDICPSAEYLKMAVPLIN
jgi:hypothetical protein